RGPRRGTPERGGQGGRGERRGGPPEIAEGPGRQRQGGDRAGVRRHEGPGGPAGLRDHEPRLPATALSEARPDLRRAPAQDARGRATVASAGRPPEALRGRPAWSASPGDRGRPGTTRGGGVATPARPGRA